MVLPANVKYHINIPVDTDLVSLTTAIDAVKVAMTGYNILQINGWRATLGADGWRISAVFYLPFPSVLTIVQDVSKQAYTLHWQMFGPITAWVHP
jgi:hypothetical protein